MRTGAYLGVKANASLDLQINTFFRQSLVKGELLVVHNCVKSKIFFDAETKSLGALQCTAIVTFLYCGMSPLGNRYDHNLIQVDRENLYKMT